MLKQLENRHSKYISFIKVVLSTLIGLPMGHGLSRIKTVSANTIQQSEKYPKDLSSL